MAVAELGSEKPRQKTPEASSCRAAWWHAGRRQLPVGTAEARHRLLPPASSRGTGITASLRTTVAHLSAPKQPAPPRERCARSGRRVGSSAGLCALGTGRADPTSAHRLLAAGWRHQQTLTRRSGAGFTAAVVPSQ